MSNNSPGCRWFVFLTISCLLCPTAYAMDSQLQESKVQPSDVATLPGQRPARKPADTLEGPPFVTCQAWAIRDAETGELLAGHDEAVIKNPASLTKIMTALLICELAKQSPEVLDEAITFSAEADQTRGSTSGIKAGEKVRVGELLYGLLLPSGNDASVALAEHFGERLSMKEELRGYDGFVAAMCRKATEIGMEKSVFKNPHGLTAPGHRTTAADMTLLACEAMKLEKFREVVNTRQYAGTVETLSGEARTAIWRNTNELLGYEGYLGVKTGTTPSAGSCLVSCAERNGRRLIITVLHSDGGMARYVDTRNLFRWIWSQQEETLSAGS